MRDGRKDEGLEEKKSTRAQVAFGKTVDALRNQYLMPASRIKSRGKGLPREK
jgi:hypothetical protein